MDQPANNCETIRPSLATRIIVRGGAAILLLAASIAALLWPTETTVNIVGGILLVLQIGALAIVLNPLARWRLASAVFLLVSGVLIYWSYWFDSDTPFSSTYSERFRAAPISGSWNFLLNRLTNYYPENDPEWWKQRPSGPLAYLHDSDTYSFEVIGLLLTSLFVGLAAAYLASLFLRRWMRSKSATASRWRFQMGLRTLMLYTLLLMLALGWIMRERQLSLKMRPAFDRMEAKDYLGGYRGRPGFFPWFNRLVWLDLPAEVYRVSFDDTAAEEDFAALANFRSLREVTITCIDDDTAERDQLLAHLRKVPGLRSFGLESFGGRGGFSAAGVRHLDGLPIEELRLVLVEGFDDAEFARLTQFKQLKVLEISSSTPDEELEADFRDPFVSDAALRHLSAFPALETLEIRCIPVSNESAEVIGNLRKLKQLRIPASVIDDDGLAHLRHLERLEVLELPATVTDQGIPHLSRLNNLKTFETNAKLTDRSMPWLGENRDLQWLTLCDAAITDEGVEHLATLSKLVILDIRSSDLTDRSLEKLGRLKELRHLSISGRGVTDEGFRHLADLQKLDSLGVSGTSIGDESMKTAEKLPQLSWFFVGRTNVGPDAINRLKKARGGWPQIDNRW